RHGATGGIADELFQLIPPMRRNRRVGVQRKAVDASATRSREPGRLTLVTKSGADTPDVLLGPFTQRDALLDRRRHGASRYRGSLAQGIIASGHGGLQVRFQIAQPTQQTDHAPTDLLDHGGDVRIGRGLARKKAGWTPLVRALEKYPFQAEHVIMHIELERTAKALDKRDRPRVDGGSHVTALDRLVDVILHDGPCTCTLRLNTTSSLVDRHRSKKA